MRLLTATALLLATLPACTKVEAPNLPPAAPAPEVLRAGSTAPPLVVTKWLKGDPWTKYEPGKVYVIDFWAIWCGPCMQSMPHLNGLVAEYKDAGLQVIAVTSLDERGNTLPRVKEFIEQGKGKRLNFNFAWCEDDATYNAFMEASGRSGIPCSFVVDQQGKIAFIGHPGELEEILPRILAGTWKGKADLDEIQASEEEINFMLEKMETAIQRVKDQGDAAMRATSISAATDMLKFLPDFEKKYPGKATTPTYQVQKIALQIQSGQFDLAKAQSEKLLKRGLEREDTSILNYLRGVWSARNINPDRKHIELAVQSAEGILKFESSDDLSALMGAAQAYYAAGDKEKADKFADQARRVAGSNPGLKDQIEKALKAFQE